MHISIHLTTSFHTKWAGRFQIKRNRDWDKGDITELSGMSVEVGTGNKADRRSLTIGELAAMEGACERRAANGREEDGPAERGWMTPRTLDTTILSFTP